MRQLSPASLSLAAHPLFDEIAPARIPALLGSSARIASFARGDLLSASVDSEPSLSFLMEGAALVYKESCDGHRLLMSRLSAGSLYGMASLYHSAPFPTAIHAETPCSVLIWPKASVETAFEKEPTLSRNYIRLLSERIHFLNHRIETLTGDDPKARLLRLLLSLPPDTAISDGSIRLPYALSQLAELLGIGRASLYRALDALEAEGAITRNGRVIRIDKTPKTSTTPMDGATEAAPNAREGDDMLGGLS